MLKIRLMLKKKINRIKIKKDSTPNFKSSNQLDNKSFYLKFILYEDVLIAKKAISIKKSHWESRMSPTDPENNLVLESSLFISGSWSDFFDAD